MSPHTTRNSVAFALTAFLSLFLFCVLMLPQSASAYTSTDQRVVKINEQTAIFFIDFRFIGATDDFYIPVYATRNLAHGSFTNAVGYTLEERGEIKTRGNTTAMVLGDAEIVDGMYRVPKNTLERFTLAVVLETSVDDPEDDYELQVTDLPFYVGDDREPRMLNIHELKHYRSPEADLNN